jgi:hypothetical protein
MRTLKPYLFLPRKLLQKNAVGKHNAIICQKTEVYSAISQLEQ